jgi:hypothetical protein
MAYDSSPLIRKERNYVLTPTRLPLQHELACLQGQNLSGALHIQCPHRTRMVVASQLGALDSQIPCECKTCFFCIRGLTHGVDHRWRGRLSTTNATETCPNERIVIAVNPQRCRACYQQLRLEHPDSTVKRVKSRCHQTRLGCSKCQVIVCEACWPSFGHDLEGKK